MGTLSAWRNENKTVDPSVCPVGQPGQPMLQLQQLLKQTTNCPADWTLLMITLSDSTGTLRVCKSIIRPGIWSLWCGFVEMVYRQCDKAIQRKQ